MTPDPNHVPITPLFNAPGVANVRLELPWGREDDPLWTPRPARIAAFDAAFGGKGRLRKRARSLVALVDQAEVIVRRPVAERALAAVPPGELVLVPVALFDDEGLVADDFVMLDPRPWFPMDRDASDAVYVDPSSPHGSPCERVDRLAWGEGRTPPYAAFRLAEQPDVLLFRRELAEALGAATKKVVATVEPPYPQDTSMALGPQPTLLQQRGVLGVELMAPAPQRPEDAAMSAEAFWSIVAGRSGASARAAACASPHYALCLARAVDRAPRDDTRQGALADPRTALLYALQVDGAPRDDTREAASRHPRASLAYAERVDHGPHEATRRGVAGSSWQGDYDARCAEGARIFAVLSGGEATSPAAEAKEPAPARETTAARAWPAHDRPRYAEDEGGAEPPTHAPLGPDLRSDVDAFIERGLELVGLAEDARPEDVVTALHAFVGEVQAKTRKLAKKKPAVMALGCAFGEQVHRALGWQWASVRAPDGGGVALVAPDRAAALYPFALVERLVAPRAKENTLALTFEMLAAGELPPGARAGAYAAIT
jgi:hypothetical protein